MTALNTALDGMQRAESSFDSAARRIAQPASAQPGSSQPEDSASLSDNAVALLQAKNDFAVNLKAAHTADEMTEATLSLLA